MSLSWWKRRNEDFIFPLKPLPSFQRRETLLWDKRKWRWLHCRGGTPVWNSAATTRTWGLWSDGGNAVINRSVGVWRLVAPLPQVWNKPGQLSFLCSNTHETDHNSACSFYGIIARSSSKKTELNISFRSARQTSSKALPLSAGGLGVGPFSASVQDFSQSVQITSLLHVCCWFKMNICFASTCFILSF